VTFTRPAAVPADVSVNGVDAAAGAPLYLSTSSGLGVSTDGGATITWRRTADGISGPRTAVYVP
jgi:hypothetical protein